MEGKDVNLATLLTPKYDNPQSRSLQSECLTVQLPTPKDPRSDPITSYVSLGAGFSRPHPPIVTLAGNVATGQLTPSFNSSYLITTIKQVCHRFPLRPFPKIHLYLFQVAMMLQLPQSHNILRRKSLIIVVNTLI